MKTHYLKPPRYNIRHQQRAIKQAEALYLSLCKEFMKGFVYAVEGEWLIVDRGAVDPLRERLDYLWRVQVNKDKEFLGDGFTKQLHMFTDTCKTMMESAADRVYVPVVLRLLDTQYGISKEEWPRAEDIARYRKDGLSAADACIRIVLHNKSEINPLKQ